MGRVIRKLNELRHGWNAFDDAPRTVAEYGGYTQSPRAQRSTRMYYSDRSFVGSIYNRLAVDYSSVQFMHCMLDENDVATELVRDDLQRMLNLTANIDQSAQALKQDFAHTMFEHGHACIIPTDCNMDPLESASYDIKTARVGTVAAWRPRHVTVNVYDDREVDEDGKPVNGGVVKQITLPKDWVVIQENPFYTVMNEPNGLLQRLIRKLNLLDSIDEAAGSGDLDIILQLPYAVRSESREKQAKERRDLLRKQLKDDELGIGYIDVSEKVIQLNRPVQNKLLEQIEYLAAAVKSELGITDEILNNTANSDTLNNYFDRTIEPIANGTALEIKRKWLTKTAITQRHSIEIYRDPLKLIPIGELAEIVDKLRRNSVVSANEIRPKIGFMPSSDPAANDLGNPNMPIADQPGAPLEAPQPAPQPPQEVPSG